MNVQQIKIHNSVTAFGKSTYSGSTTKRFNVVSGARIVFTAYCFSKDPGATVSVKVSTSFSEAMPFCDVLTLDASVVGNHRKAVMSDFHNFVDVELEVTGGNAEVIVGLNTYDNALTTRIENAEIAVDLNHLVQPNGSYDSVRIGDDEDEMAVNPDGSINVNIVNTSTQPEVIKTLFTEITNVPKDIRTLLGTYTAPSGKKSYLQRVTVSGNNYAEFELELNSNKVMKKRGWAGGNLNHVFDFDAYSENGKELSPGDKIDTYVEHARPFSGNFEITYQILEIG